MALGMRAGIRLDKAVGTVVTCGIALFSSGLMLLLSSYMPNFERKCEIPSVRGARFRPLPLPRLPGLPRRHQLVL